MKKASDLLSRNHLLILIVALAAFVRLLGLSFVPPSFNWDEVSLGYNAFSILKTGKDEWGEFFPAIFRAYGDYKLPGYIYATVPSIALFGLNEFSIRLVSALAGIGTVFFSYLLVFSLFRARPVALLTAVLISVEPWSLFLSRVAVEANLALFFVVSGVWHVIEGLQGKKKHLLLLGILLLGLSVWTYNSARIFVPLLMTSLIFLYKNELLNILKKDRKVAAYYLLLIAFLFLPMFYQLLNPTGLARHRWVAILDEGAISRINESRANSQLPDPLPLIVHNKATYFASNFIKNYFSHFSPQFIFRQGGTHYQFSVPGQGLIYPSEFIFVIVGFIWVLLKRDRTSFVILFWLIFSPIASSITREAPHPLRSVVMQPLPQILAAIGLVKVWDYFNKFKISEAWPFGLENLKLKITLRSLLITVYFISLFYFIESYAINYVGKYREEYSWAWQYGYKEMAELIKENHANYDQIIVTKKYGEPHEFILFYMNWDPEKYRNDPNLIRFAQSDWYWVDRFDKFYFVNDWEIPQDGSASWRMESGGTVPTDGRTLLITSPGNYPLGWNQLETINFLDGKPAFEILEKI